MSSTSTDVVMCDVTLFLRLIRSLVPYNVASAPNGFNDIACPCAYQLLAKVHDKDIDKLTLRQIFISIEIC